MTQYVFDESDWWRQYRRLLSKNPVSGDLSGLKSVADDLCVSLTEAGFKVVQYSESGHPPVLVAQRVNTETAGFVGIYNHYDIMPGPIEESSQCKKVGRYFGRGLADNLGSLCQRLQVLGDSTRKSIFWVIQGEEETGSELAFQVFSDLEPPEIDVWLDETGYFYDSDRQRLLIQHENLLLDAVVSEIKQIAQIQGRSVSIENRTLNKLQGRNNCPFLVKLLRGRPYLAIGPNDDSSCPHGQTESLSVSELQLSSQQLHCIVNAES